MDSGGPKKSTRCVRCICLYKVDVEALVLASRNLHLQLTLVLF